MSAVVPLATSASIGGRVQVVAVIVTAIMLGVILELVRRRRLVERYALLWMSAAAALLVVAVWRGALNVLADLLGIAAPVNALFLVAFGVTIILLLHFSIATSRLSEETKILAQEVARLDAEARAAREAMANGDGAGPAADSPEPSVTTEPGQPALAEPEPPSTATTTDQ
jgi:hypothetical protein